MKLRSTLLPLVAFATFAVGVSAWSITQTFSNHGCAPAFKLVGLRTENKAVASAVVGVRFKIDALGRVTRAAAFSGDEAYFRQAVAATFDMQFAAYVADGSAKPSEGIVVHKFVGKDHYVMAQRLGPSVSMSCPSTDGWHRY